MAWALNFHSHASIWYTLFFWVMGFVFPLSLSYVLFSCSIIPSPCIGFSFIKLFLDFMSCCYDSPNTQAMTKSLPLKGEDDIQSTSDMVPNVVCLVFTTWPLLTKVQVSLQGWYWKAHWRLCICLHLRGDSSLELCPSIQPQLSLPLWAHFLSFFGRASTTSHMSC